MKLQFKIFISILFVSLATLSASSYYLINRNHITNVNREQERSLNEFDFIETTLNNNVDFNASSTETLKLVISRYGDLYAQRGIELMIFRDNTAFYSDFTVLSENRFSPMLSVQPGTNQVQIFSVEKQHFILVSGRLTSSDYVFVYARDISDIYEARTQNIVLSLFLAAGLILLLSLLTYLYSGWITKPIILLNQGADAISKGNYQIRIPETKDEFNSLGVAYNQMASAIEGRTRELEEKARELQVFIDDLSHEMNTPLTSIQGYSEFLRNANATEEQKQKAVDTIRSESVRMKDIYTKLMTLAFAREHDPELTPVKILDLFNDIKNTFEPQLQEYHIVLNLQSSLDTLMADRTLIQMMISNLVKNSIQAIQKDGLIFLKSYLEGGNAVLEVSDNGCGIPKDKIDEVIKPFFRVDKSRSRKTGGAGLGLSICKSIADLHHAELSITSEPGKGTCIKVTFYNSVTTSLLD
jgi:signal transduction histidine kinase